MSAMSAIINLGHKVLSGARVSGLLMLALAGVLSLLMGCGASGNKPNVELIQDMMESPALKAQDFRVINRSYAISKGTPYIGHMFKPGLGDAVTQWANARFQAAGDAGHATLLIRDASLTFRPLPDDRSLTGAFTRQQALQ